MVNPRDIVGNVEEKKKNGESQIYSWGPRRKRRIVNPRDIAGDQEEEEEESHSKALFEIFTISNTYAQVARTQSCTNHVQHIERLSRASVMLHATWYEGTAQLLSLTELKSHLFKLYFIG